VEYADVIQRRRMVRHYSDRPLAPEEYDPIGGITIGYRAADLPPQPPRIDERRRTPAQVVHRGQWGRH
jgi:hypothetical protein